LIEPPEHSLINSSPTSNIETDPITACQSLTFTIRESVIKSIPTTKSPLTPLLETLLDMMQPTLHPFQLYYNNDSYPQNYVLLWKSNDLEKKAPNNYVNYRDSPLSIHSTDPPPPPFGYMEKSQIHLLSFHAQTCRSLVRTAGLISFYSEFHYVAVEFL